MLPQIRRQNSPPDHQNARWVRRLKANEEITFAILSEHFWGFASHWDGRRTIACVEPRQHCTGCQEKRKSRWRGYLHVLDQADGKDLFLELTESAQADLNKAIPPGPSLRGYRCQIRRGNGIKARLVVKLLGKAPVNEAWPASLDPIDTIQSLWGVAATRHLGPRPEKLPFSETA